MNDSTNASSLPQLALVAGSGLVAAVGLVGNAALLAALCTQQSARLRNKLLLHVCAADLLVCAVSVPLATSARWGWAMGRMACYFVAFFQAVPVSASTLSLTMLALDRYAVVTHPRLRHRRYVAGTMMATVWILTLLCCATQPLLRCPESWGSPLLRVVLTLIHLAVVHVAPCVAVTLCHIVVAMKLVETSLTAAAARGEVPLPMPLLCRPRHVIIVASVANEGPSKVVPYRHRANLDEDPSSDDDDLALRIQADLADLRARLPRSKAKHRLQKKHLRFSGKPLRADKRLRKPPPPLLVKPAVGQSLKSRRRLARMLVVQLTLFALLWLPLVACELCVQLAPSPDAAKARSLLPLCLLLGHTHSAVSPLLYWLLNRQALQGCVAARALHSKFRLFRLPNANAAANANYNPSSTNEAALGAFHPRYITPRPPPRCATSQFLQ